MSTVPETQSSFLKVAVVLKYHEDQVKSDANAMQVPAIPT
jgi:hypothetical protein